MKTKITFRHFHNGNDPDHVVRGTAVYATRARLVDLDTGKAIKETWCYCSPRDNPSRKMGRQIALARLDKAKAKVTLLDRFRTAKASALAVLGV